MACRAAYVEAVDSVPEVAQNVFARLDKSERNKLVKYTSPSSNGTSPSSYGSGRSPR